MREPQRRVLLLNPPGRHRYQRDGYCSVTSKARYYTPPIDLLVASGRLSESHDVDVMDAIAQNLSDRACLRRLKRRSYEAIVALTGLSSHRGDSLFLRRLRQSQPDATVVVGGGFLLSGPDAYLRAHPWVDAVLLDFTGDGLQAVLADRATRHPGVYTRRDLSSGSVKPPGPPALNYPLPRHHLFPLDRYDLPHAVRRPVTKILSSFGCPYRCGYCVYSTIPYRARRVEHVVEEMKAVRTLGIPEVFFCDPTFGVLADHTLRLCRRLEEERVDLSWICETRADLLDRSRIAAMKRAGCHAIQIGVETASEKGRAAAGKNLTDDQLRSAFSLCQEAGIETLAHAIVGLPGENEEDILRTVRFLVELDVDYAAFNVAVGIPGTRLHRCTAAPWRTVDDGERDSSIRKSDDTLGDMSSDRLWLLQRRAMREFYLRPAYAMRAIRRVRSFYRAGQLATNGLHVLWNSTRG